MIRRTPAARGKRLAVLTAATLTAPAMLAVAAVRAGNSELLVIVGAATTLTALVVVRLAGLVARHERSERRERVLGSAAAALATAWTREDIYRVAVDAALEIAAKHGAHPLRGVANYRDMFKLSYLRGPSGIIVMLNEDLRKR